MFKRGCSTWNCAIIISSANVMFRLQNVCRMQTSPRDWAVIELDETFRHQVTGGMFVEGYDPLEYFLFFSLYSSTFDDIFKNYNLMESKLVMVNELSKRTIFFQFFQFYY